MRIAYFDFSGASGDMILGSMIDAGLNIQELREELKKIPIPKVQLSAKKVLKRGISATQVIITGKKEKKSYRTLNDILKIVEKSRLEPEVKKKSKEVFERIASVEGQIHQKPAKEIHFHELSGLDSIVDIVGSLWGYHRLGIEKLYVSKVNVGSEKRKATLQFEDGSTETFSVRPDVDLSRHKVGERVIFRVTEMIAIWVEKPQ